MRDLGRGPQRQRAFARMVRRDHAARLDWHRRQPLVIQPVRDHAIRSPERFVYVAASGDRMRVRDIRSEVWMRQRRARLDCLFGVHDDRQRIVVDVDRVDGVARDVGVGGHRYGDGVADEVDAVACEDGVRRRLQAGDRRGARHGAARRVHVGAGKDADHAGDRLRGRGVDADDARMRVRAAQDRGVQQARELHVVDVGADALDQARILDPLHRAADVRRGVGVSHGPPPIRCG